MRVSSPPIARHMSFATASLVFVVALLIPLTARSQTTYTWVGPSGSSWSTATNWSPNRSSPAPDDVLVFDGSITPSATVMSVPTQSVGQIKVMNAAATSLFGLTPGSTTLTLTGGAGEDLDVSANCHFIVQTTGTNTFAVELGSGATALVAGHVLIAGLNGRLLATDPNSLVFASGAVVDYGNMGTPFGTTGLNSVVFQAGSTYTANGTGDVFGATAPNSVVTFQAGSLYRLTGPALPPMNGRTFADLEINSSLSPAAATGSLTCTIQNLILKQGSPRLNLLDLHIRGDIRFQGGGLIFNPGSSQVVALDGSAPQALSGNGSWNLNSNAHLQFVNPAGVILQRDLSPSLATVVAGGKLILNGPFANLQNNGAFNVAGTLQFDMVQTPPTGFAFAYGPGSELIFNQSTSFLVASPPYWPDGATSPTNVTIQGGGTVEFQGGLSRTVPGTLTLTSGVLDAGTGVVAIGSAGSVAGGGPTSHVKGRLQKGVPVSAGPVTCSFEIGDGTVYAPVILAFPSVSTGGSIEASTTPGDHPNISSSGLDAARTVNRTWTITNGGIVFTPCSATFTYDASDLDPAASPAQFEIRRFSSPATWSQSAVGTRTATSTEGIGLTAFGDFVIGNPPVTFTDIVAGLPGVFDGSTAWGDYDGDGDLDLVMAGETRSGPPRIARIYRNGGGANPTFTDLGAGLPGVSRSGVGWGDYDRDGDLDLLLSGDTGAGWITRLYRNSGGLDPTFTDVGAGFVGLQWTGVSWGDYDNDGDLDLLLAGGSFNGLTTRIYRNNGGANPTFTDIQAPLQGCQRSGATWVDFDNDGDLDATIFGPSDIGYLARIYRNDGGTAPEFTIYDMGIQGVDVGSHAWGDYDNDGDLDLLLAGEYPAGVYTTRIYRNSGGANPTFTDIGAGIVGVRTCSVAWGDYDNDGNLDLVESGYGQVELGGFTWVTRIYRNSGGPNPTFTNIGASLPQVYFSSVAWGDYDNDQDLDLVVTGVVQALAYSQILRSDHAAPNTPPSAPTGLAANANGDQVTFSWNAASDAQTPAVALSYNLRVGTTPNGIEVSAALADVSNGYRRVVALGNGQLRTSWTLRLPGPGDYYWSVQAIDGAWAGSPFAVEALVETVDVPRGSGAPLAAIVAPNPVRGPGFLMFTTSRVGPIRVELYDVQGREVARPMDEPNVLHGRHDIALSGLALPAGLYFYRITAAEGELRGRFVVLK